MVAGRREVGMTSPALEQALRTLAAEMGAECAAAVDPLEIAAALEADGVSDEEAAQGYGCVDVFELGDRLYATTVRRPPAGERPGDRWQTRATHHLLRGVLFGLPGVCYAAAAPSVASPGAAAVLLFSLVL